MTTDSRARPQQTVLKEKSGYWAAILLWTAALAALLLLFILAEGESLLTWIPWSLVVAAFAYIFLWIPRLVFDDDSVLIINSFRSHAIPFAVVDDVSTGSTVTIRAAGKTYTSWGAPFPPSARAAGSQRSGAIGPATVTPWDRPGAAGQRQGLEQHPLVRAWTRSRTDRTPSVPPGEAAAVTSWNKSALVLALLCGLLLAGQQLMLFLFQT